MKTKLIYPVIILACLFLNPFIIQAQSPDFIPEPAKGHWEVHTDHKTLNTVVQFFNKSRQMVYQETLQRKYVKLNKKNIRRFDDLLEKLETSDLLGGQIKTYDLVADSRTVFRDISAPEDASSALNYHQTAESNVYLLKNGKLKIYVTNPIQELYDISIVDEESRSIYYEKFADPKYSRWFDMSKLQEGAYKINIKGPRKRLAYKMQVDGYLGYLLTPLK